MLFSDVKIFAKKRNSDFYYVRDFGKKIIYRNKKHRRLLFADAGVLLLSTVKNKILFKPPDQFLYIDYPSS